MTPPLKALRVSAWFLFAMGLLHIAGHLRGRAQLTNPPDAQTRQLADAMRGYVVPDFPISRSVLELYLGFSLAMGLLSMVVGALVLVTLTELKDKPESLRRLSRMYAAGLLVFSIVSVTYFVWPPTIFLLVSLGLSLFALLRFRKAA